MVAEEERGNFALIRFLNKVYQLDRQTWGHPIAAVLVRTILEGERNPPAKAAFNERVLGCSLAL
jgi:hypothetical protein